MRLDACLPLEPEGVVAEGAGDLAHKTRFRPEAGFGCNAHGQAISTLPPRTEPRTCARPTPALRRLRGPRAPERERNPHSAPHRLIWQAKLCIVRSAPRGGDLLVTWPSG